MLVTLTGLFRYHGNNLKQNVDRLRSISHGAMSFRQKKKIYQFYIIFFDCRGINFHSLVVYKFIRILNCLTFIYLFRSKNYKTKIPNILKHEIDQYLRVTVKIESCEKINRFSLLPDKPSALVTVYYKGIPLLRNRLAMICIQVVIDLIFKKKIKNKNNALLYPTRVYLY